jgi:putative methyltransferase (TIGR04325 family)
MKVRELAKLLLPPILVDSAKRIVRRTRAIANSNAAFDYQYIPEGWDCAATRQEVKGWDVQAILEIQKEKWSRFRSLVEGTGPLGISHEGNLETNTDLAQHNRVMIFAYSVALASRGSDSLSMLDWGGGIGHYYVLAKSLLPGVKIEYHCKDLPLLAQHGSQLFPDQRFYSDDECLNGSYDFVMASSSLHYSQDWEQTFSRLAGATTKYLLVTRLPTVAEVPSFVFLQRPYAFGYDTEYLGWCLNRGTFLAEAEKLGLVLVREFIIGQRPPIIRAPEQAVSRGFLFRAARPK